MITCDRPGLSLSPLWFLNASAQLWGSGLRGEGHTIHLTIANSCASFFLPTAGPFWKVPGVTWKQPDWLVNYVVEAELHASLAQPECPLSCPRPALFAPLSTPLGGQVLSRSVGFCQPGFLISCGGEGLVRPSERLNWWEVLSVEKQHERGVVLVLNPN